MTIEIWKDIKGYEGIYEVSSFGRVRTHKDKITHSTMTFIPSMKVGNL